MTAWGNNFLKSHSPAGRIHSPLATGRVLMKKTGFVFLFFFVSDLISKAKSV